MRETQRGRGVRVATALVVTLVLASPVGVYTKTVGKGADPMLAAFEMALDAQGIDVVPGLARDVDFTTDLRPRLTKLGGFPVPAGDHRRPSPNDWTGHFQRGAFDFLVAYRPPEVRAAPAASPPDINQFLDQWSKASQAERIFMAYTRDDAASANKVAEVLRAHGYVVFTYLRGTDTAPWAKPEVVGQLFREAGHHFVIDTPTARKSSGVVFEALALARLKETTKRAAPTSTARGCRDIFMGPKNVK